MRVRKASLSVKWTSGPRRCATTCPCSGDLLPIGWVPVGAQAHVFRLTLHPQQHRDERKTPGEDAQR